MEEGEAGQMADLQLQSEVHKVVSVTSAIAPLLRPLKSVAGQLPAQKSNKVLPPSWLSC